MGSHEKDNGKYTYFMKEMDDALSVADPEVGDMVLLFHLSVLDSTSFNMQVKKMHTWKAGDRRRIAKIPKWSRIMGRVASRWSTHVKTVDRAECLLHLEIISLSSFVDRWIRYWLEGDAHIERRYRLFTRSRHYDE